MRSVGRKTMSRSQQICVLGFSLGLLENVMRNDAVELLTIWRIMLGRRLLVLQQSQPAMIPNIMVPGNWVMVP
jgi:hypothetical protein